MLRLVSWPSMMLLGWTETKLWTLKYGSKSIQTSLLLRQCPPKSYKLLDFFRISVTLYKMDKHSDSNPSFFQIVGVWRDFTVVTKLIKNFKSLYGFGGRCVKIRDVCMDFEPYFKVHVAWSLSPLKALYLIKWPIAALSLMWRCQFIDLLKFETRTSSLLNFGTTNRSRLQKVVSSAWFGC